MTFSDTEKVEVNDEDTDDGEDGTNFVDVP